MLFFIGASVANSVAQGNRDSIDCIFRLLDSRKRGLLLLYASRKSVEKISHYLVKNSDHHENSLLISISKKFIEKKELIREVSRFVYLTNHTREVSLRNERIIAISPSLLNYTNMLYPPILLGENHTDCDLYANVIASNFLEGLPTSLKNLRLSDRFESGGGNNTHVPYKRYKDKKIDLCFCIVDSDRKSPDEHYGDTAKFVVKVDKKNRSAACDHMVIDMYSAENLLPIEEIFRQFKIGKNGAQLAEFETTKTIRTMGSWRYLPLKKGVIGKDVKKNSASATFWKAEISKIGVPLPCCDILECNCNLVPPISEKTLANALNTKASGWPKTLHQENNTDVKDVYLRLSKE